MTSHTLLKSVLVGLAVAVATSPAVAAARPTAHAAAAVPATHGVHPRPERHPAIRAAIRSLEKAKADMQHANHDFGGHRVEAIAAVDNAIAQLRVALQYDSK